jgi:hypothetical protein
MVRKGVVFVVNVDDDDDVNDNDNIVYNDCNGGDDDNIYDCDHDD